MIKRSLEHYYVIRFSKTLEKINCFLFKNISKKLFQIRLISVFGHTDLNSDLYILNKNLNKFCCLL